ncbi:hypothetical protein F511_10717 [Dorcoceras hygrometricum]|uniref:Uncharacterized protein n=1 Tax=Dorcoceras hygrometricum TaxID=472368 RepID=A0A2Z7A9G0_9LAMI|nr:hypothetical protein F511_10717 [Dorcoceras hygrometricum]
MHDNKATIESRVPKDLNSCSTHEFDQLNNSDHGVCEYMGATHSSPHTTPDAKHSSTCCCPTHEVWELPTPLIVAKRSQHGDEDAKHSSTCCCPTHEVSGATPSLIVAKRSQHGDEGDGSYPLGPLNKHPGTTRIKITRHGLNRSAQYEICVYAIDKMSNTEHIQRCKAYTAARTITHAQSKAVKQAHIRTSSILSYNYHKTVPSNTDLTPAKPNTDTSSGTVAQKLQIGSYELNQIYPTLLSQQKALSEAQDYRREMSSRTYPAVCKLLQAVPNETSQQEESSTTTLTSIGAAYRWKSNKIRFDEQ